MNAHINAHVHTTTHTCTHNTMCTQDGASPLHIASQKGHNRIVEMLLQAGATVDLQNKVENCYYLFICHLIVLCHTHYSLYKVVELLIGAEANPHQQDKMRIGRDSGMYSNLSTFDGT